MNINPGLTEIQREAFDELMRKAYGVFENALPVSLLREPDKPVRVLWRDVEGHEWTSNIFGYDWTSRGAIIAGESKDGG